MAVEVFLNAKRYPLNAIPCLDFSLRHTLGSGQLFRWQPTGPRAVVPPPLAAAAGPKAVVSDRKEVPSGARAFIGWIGSDLVWVKQQNSQLVYQGTSPQRIRRFFSLDLDYGEITRQIDVDPIIHEALESYWGLRVLRQDPWECLASFILSSFNNIPRLSGMLERLAIRFGEPAEATHRGWDLVTRGQDTPAPGVPSAHRSSAPAWRPHSVLGRALPRPPKDVADSGTMPARPAEVRSGNPPSRGPVPPLAYRFPRPEVLASVSEKALRHCGLGYRAPYLKAAAEAVASSRLDLARLNDLDDETLRNKLLTIPGVGEKVVECVMLFGFARASAFPVDVWIGRWMRARYFSRDAKVTGRQIRAFSYRHFGPYCGWAQQFLYCRARGVRPQGV